MKKAIAIMVFLCGILAVGAVQSQAVLFDDLETLNRTITDAGSYTHTLEMIPAGSYLNWADISITHRGNIDSYLLSEVWLVSGEDSFNIGRLSNSTDWLGRPVTETDTFHLSRAVLDSIAGTNWMLQVSLDEDTWFDGEQLTLVSSLIHGDYTAAPVSSPVPEPSSMMFVMSGFLGMAGFGSRKLFVKK